MKIIRRRAPRPVLLDFSSGEWSAPWRATHDVRVCHRSATSPRDFILTINQFAHGLENDHYGDLGKVDVILATPSGGMKVVRTMKSIVDRLEPRVWAIGLNPNQLKMLRPSEYNPAHLLYKKPKLLGRFYHKNDFWKTLTFVWGTATCPLLGEGDEFLSVFWEANRGH